MTDDADHGAARRTSPAQVAAARRAALRHGGHAELLIGPLAEDILAEVEAACAGTPAGAPAFRVLRALLARKLARLRLVAEHLERAHSGSPVGSKGRIINAARLELDLLASVERTLGELGLSPAAAARLGVDLARGTSLAEEIEKARAAREAAEARMRAAEEEA